jgi:hypothetical protein
VAVAVSAILVTALYATFFGVFRAADASETGLNRRIETGRLVLRLSRDVRSAYFKPGLPQSRFFADKKGLNSFVSFATVTRPVIGSGSPSSGLVGVRYFVEEGPDGLSVFKEAWDLFREEKTSVDLIAGVESFEISFYNGRDWAKAWDSDLEGALPHAVKVELALTDGETASMVSRIMVR